MLHLMREGHVPKHIILGYVYLDFKIDKVEWRRVKEKCSGMKLKFNSMFYLKFSLINIIL